MNRRGFVAWLGTAASGGSVTLGTGAFSTVEAERTVSLNVAEEYNAYLKLTERGTGGRSVKNGNVTFSIPGPSEDQHTDSNPAGVGPDSIYRFGSNAGSAERGLVAIENQGTQSVEVFSTHEGSSGKPSITLYNVDTGNLLIESSPSRPLAVGQKILCGLEIDTHGITIESGLKEFTVTVKINAVAPDTE